MRTIRFFLIILVPLFFYLNPLLPWPKDLIFEAAGHGSGVLAFFDAQKTGQPAPFFWGHTSYLLGQVTLMITYLFFGVSTFTTILNTSILAFLTILATYFFSKKFLGFGGGLLTLLLFSGSLFFLMVIKTAYPFYGTIPLTVTLAVFIFLLAHEKKSKEYLLLSGVAFAFVGFSGGQPVPLLLAVFILYLAWKIVRKEKLFSTKQYLSALSMAMAIFLGFHALFPLINNNKPFDYLYDSYRLLSERGGQVALKGGPKERIENTNRMVEALFVDMGIPGQGHQQSMAKRAMIPPFVSIFFFLGIIISLKRRKDIDKMLILWIGVVFLFYGLMADFQVRYFVVVAPAIYVLAAGGMVYLLEKMNGWRFLKIGFSIFLSVMIGLYLAKTYNDYYVVLAKQAFKLEQYEGQAEMAEFVKKNYDPKDTLLVMGNTETVPPYNFVFYTWKKNYALYYWGFFSHEVTYTPVEAEVIRRNPSGGKGELQVQNLIDWEQKKLKVYPKIVYIFGLYNNDLTPTREWALFRQMRPYLEAKKVIFSASGLPWIGIYEITPEIEKVASLEFKLKEGEKQKFLAMEDKKVKSLVFSGSSEKPTLFLNGTGMELPIKTYFSKKMILNFEGKSELSLSSSFASENFAADVYRQENITRASSASLVFGGEKKEGELVYRFSAPTPIEKLNILFFPRILNDKAKKVNLSLSYSPDDKNYQKLYELKSDGSAGWVGLWEKQERLMIYPQSKVVYLKFILSGQQAQLLSSNEVTMSFEGEFNWQAEVLQIKAGENLLWQTGAKEPLSLSLFF